MLAAKSGYLRVGTKQGEWAALTCETQDPDGFQAREREDSREEVIVVPHLSSGLPANCGGEVM